MKKIFNVHLFNDSSGSPRVFRDAIEANYDNVNIVMTSQHQGFLTNIGDEQCSIYYKRFNNKFLTLMSLLISQFMLFCVLSAKLIKARVKREKTIVFVNTMLPFGAALSGKLFANRVVYYVHETFISPYIFKCFLRLVIQICANDIIFVSKYVMEAESFKNINQQVIYNGLRNDFVELEEVKWQPKFDNKQILFVGSLKAYKGIFEFIELSIKLKGYKFLAAFNCEEHELNTFKNTIEYNNNLKLLARPNNIIELYQQSFLVVNLTNPKYCIETFGLTIIEGMSCGCPVIVPPAGGPLEVIDQYCGKAINVNNQADMIDFIESLDDRETWLAFAKAAKQRAELFNQSKYKLNIQDFFKALDKKAA